MKKILIISREDDSMTSSVINWLNFKGRIVEKVDIGISENIPKVSVEVFNNRLVLPFINNYSAVWFRFNQRTIYPLNYVLKEAKTPLEAEINQFKNIFYKVLANRLPSLGYCNEGNFSILNKFTTLLTALESGLIIPDSLITNDFKDLTVFKSSKESIIVKPITEGFSFKKRLWFYKTYTSEVERLPNTDSLFPSLFQENIKRKFDVRVFFLDKQFFAAAILPYKNQSNYTDYRVFHSQLKSRVVPINLPTSLMEKIINFMGNMKMNVGVLDFIYTTDKKYVFLEVNPSGIFDDLSHFCNYNIDLHISNYLITKSDEKNKEKYEF